MSIQTDTAPPAPPPAAPRRRHVVRWVVAAVTVPLLLGGLGLWWVVLRHDAPAAVTLDQAVAGVAAPASTSVGVTTTAGLVSGTWTIDSSITNADGTGSFGGFRVGEQLVGVGTTTAVGRSAAVAGTVAVDGTRVTAAQFTVDLKAITSNDSRRNSAIQNALATGRYPTATFVLTQPIDVGSVPGDGEKISVKATGNLTIHGVTRPVTIDMDAQLQSGVLVIVGTSPVSFADYNITTPTATIVASVDNHGTIEFQLYLTKS